MESAPRSPLTDSEVRLINRMAKDIQPFLAQINQMGLLGQVGVDAGYVKQLQAMQPMLQTSLRVMQALKVNGTLEVAQKLAAQLGLVARQFNHLPVSLTKLPEIARMAEAFLQINSGLENERERIQRNKAILDRAFDSYPRLARQASLEPASTSLKRHGDELERSPLDRAALAEFTEAVKEMITRIAELSKEQAIEPSKELAGVVLRLVPGRNTPSLMIKLINGTESRKVSLQRNEYTILHRLARQLHLDARNRTLDADKKGWVDRTVLLHLIAKSSGSGEAAAHYLAKILSMLRAKIGNIIEELGAHVDRRRIIEYSPHRTLKRGAYRLSIPPHRVILPKT